MAKKKVFISFDFDNDRSQRDLLIGQSKLGDSPFDVSDYSLKEAAPERDWLAKAHRAIARSDAVIVLLGSKTKRAPGVRKEVKIANDLGKTRFQIIGYQNGTSAWAVEGGGRTYKWTWQNLKSLLG